MANYFFEKYRPEICRGLHKWCCEQILRHLRLFWAKKIFFKNWKFFDFFCLSGVTDFLKNDQLLFWEIPAWNLSWTAQMVLRTNFKAFKVVSREQKFFQKLEIFWLFLHIRGHRFFEKWPTSFFERYRPEICRGLHKWCCKRISRRSRLFRGKKNFFWKLAFFDFFCISRVTDFLKNDQLLFWEIPAWNFSWTAQMVLRTNFKAFKVVVSEKIFFQKFEIFWLFCISGVTDFLKNDQLLFLRDTDLKFVVDCTNGVANEFQGVLGCFKRKNSFLKIGNFLTFFAYRGARDFMKHHQWNWSKTPQMVYFENKLRHFSLFPSKIIFYYNLQFLEFFPCL